MSELSIVNIAPEIYKDRVNELAELLGKGPNNLSVQLQDNNGNIYYGCNSEAWTKADYEAFIAMDLPEFKDALDSLIWSVIDKTERDEYDPYIENWLPTLEKYGLRTQDESQ